MDEKKQRQLRKHVRNKKHKAEIERQEDIDRRDEALIHEIVKKQEIDE